MLEYLSTCGYLTSVDMQSKWQASEVKILSHRTLIAFTLVVQEKTQSGLIPRTLETMSLTWWDGLTLGLLGIVSSTYGHCRKYLMWELFLFSWGRDFLFCNSSVFIGRRTGGRSGHILILSWIFLSFRAPSSHLLRWLRSRKRRMIPASFLRDSRCHAAKSASAASSMSRCWRASLTHALRVAASSSSGSPLSPCTVRDHFRLWTSISRVWRARADATCSTWLARAGRATFSKSSMRLLVNCKSSMRLLVNHVREQL